jgi:hypothetical protein
MKLFKLFLIIGLFIVNADVKAEGGEISKPVDIVVYRSPSCGCCGKWLGHLKESNFNVKDIVTSDVQAIKSKYGVPDAMASCHTALVEGYVIEGHVPANDINALLKTKPKVAGIAVPDMPAGTPGMEMGDKKDPYQVISFDNEKHYQVFNSYESK